MDSIKMISDVCFEYLETDEFDKLMYGLKRYISDEFFTQYYTGDVRVRIDWILRNYSNYKLDDHFLPDDQSGIYKWNELRKQVQMLLTELDTPPTY